MAVRLGIALVMVAQGFVRPHISRGFAKLPLGRRMMADNEERQLAVIKAKEAHLRSQLDQVQRVWWWLVLRFEDALAGKGTSARDTPATDWHSRL